MPDSPSDSPQELLRQLSEALSQVLDGIAAATAAAADDPDDTRAHLAPRLAAAADRIDRIWRLALQAVAAQGVDTDDIPTPHAGTESPAAGPDAQGEAVRRLADLHASAEAPLNRAQHLLAALRRPSALTTEGVLQLTAVRTAVLTAASALNPPGPDGPSAAAQQPGPQGGSGRARRR
ncbi:hypothetical protein BIV57_18730 [Mangrovactinospora gilvigrisea]|uniref:Uncharacterized protein n=1 Tax=Mangrovactinospora gilvigrisea TaxID=1428644 RepID=A0A1J7C314_9ACTN|nr:hypothetical protein [Mangrovactinospora gilvigrisea]OIV35956.1 hypothetical protein BIV57_18730 [Mangrovactinospora gilvigrisea]